MGSIHIILPLATLLIAGATVADSGKGVVCQTAQPDKVISFHNIGQRSLSEIISESVDYDFSENRRLQDTILTPYVQSISEEMEVMDSRRTKEEILQSGPVRIFLSTDEKVDRIHSRHIITFDISDVSNVNISLAHFVIDETEGMDEQIRVKTTLNTNITVIHTDIGFIANITTELRLPATHFQLIVETSNFQEKPLNAILTIYEKFSKSDILELENFIFKMRKRKKRSTNSEEANSNDVTDTVTISVDRSPTRDPNICSVKPWIADFDALNWNWLMSPRRYAANVCKGICPSPLTNDVYYNSSEHALVKSYYHILTGFRDTSVPRVCCTPIKFAPLTIIYRARNNEILLKPLPEARVTACGCR